MFLLASFLRGENGLIVSACGFFNLNERQREGNWEEIISQREETGDL